MTLDDFRPDESGDDSAQFDPAEPRAERHDARRAVVAAAVAVVGIAGLVLAFVLV